MKQYKSVLLALVLSVSMVCAAGTVSAGSSTGGTSSSGGSTVHFTSNTPSGTTGYTTNGIGQVTGSFSTNCQNCATGGGSTGGGGGGGGGFGGGGIGPTPPPPPPPPVCKITADKTVIGLGQSKIHLSWTPTPTTNVSLQRQAVGMKLAEGTSAGVSEQASIILAGGGGTTVNKAATTEVVGKVLIAPPSTAESFDDIVNVALSGAGTNMTTVISKNGMVPDQQASIILAGGGGTTVNPAPVIKTAVNKNGGSITYNLSFNAAKKRNGGSANLIEGVAQASQQATAVLAGGGGGTVVAPVTYTCSVTVKIVAKITECNDGIDNADPEDTLIDQQDPGCHTDGNPANALSYDPTILNETNTAVDLIAHITAPRKSIALQPLQISVSEENLSPLFVTANTLVSGWRNTATVGTPSCGINGSQCFTANGHSYIRASSLSLAFLPRALQLDTPYSFTPQTPGTYEVCAVADYYNVIQEGVAGEANNVACQTVTVDQGVSVATPSPSPTPSTITGPVSLTASPTRVKRGSTTTLTWDTGGRTKCTLKGMNGQVINLTGAASASSAKSSPITAETKYTLTCLDDNTTADATVKILPQYQEI